MSDEGSLCEGGQYPQGGAAEIDLWVNMWNKGDMNYAEKINPRLHKHFENLMAGKKKARVLVPLCGKCGEMKWFADLGHDVVGVDVAEAAVESFYKEQKIEFVVEDVPAVKGKLYKSRSGNIKIYVCDVFLFNETIEGKFDAMWDIGGLGSLHESGRDSYVSTLKKLMAPGCRYMVELFASNNSSSYQGPPYCFNEDDLKKIFGDICSRTEKLETGPMDYFEPEDSCSEENLEWQIAFYCLTRS